MKKLYQFEFDYGRMGSLDGLFIADEDEVKSIIGTEVYFGEVLGKHSEVYGDMEESMFTVVDLPANVTNILEDKLGATISGYNPFDFQEEEE